MKKRPLVRTLRWDQRRDFFDSQLFTTRFTLAREQRQLRNEVGAALNRLGNEGRVTFLDKGPELVDRHLVVVGMPSGILVTYFDGGRFSPVSEFVSMCVPYRNRIVGGVGKVRWAKVKVTA